MRRISNLRSASLRTLAAAFVLALSGCLSIDSPLGGAALVIIVSGNEQTIAPNARRRTRSLFAYSITPPRRCKE